LDTADGLGLPVNFEFEGKTWQVAPRDFELEGMFSRWVANEALQAVLAHADGVPGHVVQVLLDGWRNDKAARVYDYTGWVCAQALASDEGKKQMAVLQLCKLNKLASRALVDRVWKDKARREQLLLKMAEASGELEAPRPNGEQEGQPASPPSAATAP
jgi:hypothetical protein